MKKLKTGVRFNKKRLTVSKSLKRKILLDVIKGKNPQDAIKENIYGSSNILSSDKKYASKLIHKWRKEAYDNIGLLYLINQDITPEMLQEEIDNMSDEEEIKADKINPED